MARPLIKYWIAAGVLLIVVGGVLLASRPSYQPPPLPNPNGFHDYLQAARVLKRAETEPENFRTNAVLLRAYLEDNKEALNYIRLGLTRESQVSYPLDKYYIKRRIQEKWWNIRKAGTLLELEGRLRELAGDTNGAASNYLDFLRFSQEAYRGGPMIDAMIGFACEIQATRPFARVVPTLTADQCRVSIAALDRIESQREMVEDVLQREQTWMQNNASLKEKILVFLPSHEASTLREARATFEEDNLSRRRALLRVKTELASRAFQLTGNRPPTNIAELVPALLKTPPLDPATKKRLTLEEISAFNFDTHKMPPLF